MGALALIAILLSAGPVPAESSVSFDAATTAFVADSGFVVLAAGTPVGLRVQSAAAGDALFFDLVRVGPIGVPGALTLRVRFGEAEAADMAALTVKTPVRIERKVAAGPGGNDVYASNPARHRLALPRGDTQVLLVADGDGAVRIRIGRSRARARAAAVSEITRPPSDAASPPTAARAPGAATEGVPDGPPALPEGGAAAGASLVAAETEAAALTAPEPTPARVEGEPAPPGFPAVSPPPPDATAPVEPLAPEGAQEPEASEPLAAAPVVGAPITAAAAASPITLTGDVRIGVRGLFGGLQPVAPMGVARLLIGSRQVAAGLAVDFDLSHADVEVPQASWDAASTQVRVEARLQSPAAFQLGAVSLTPALVVGLGARAVAHSIVTALPSARALHVWQLGAAGRMEAEVSTPLGPGHVVVSLPVDVAADPFGPVAGFVPLAVGILVGYRLAP